VPVDEQVVQVNRLHILKRFYQYLHKAEGLAGLDDIEMFRRYRELLATAYQDFVASTPQREKVFKVFQDRRRHPACAAGLAARQPARAAIRPTPPEPRSSAMHIVVCIKQVPDSAQIRVHPVTNTIMRQGVPAIVNPYDLFALEEALRLKDQFGGRVTMLCMGPPQAEDALRKCISFGATDAVLVTDRAFAGADTLATSYALAAAIRKIGQEQAVDLVFTGKQTIDGDTAQVGPGIAKRLG
jgi:electron transfer flavoprotein beta subunit